MRWRGRAGLLALAVVPLLAAGPTRDPGRWRAGERLEYQVSLGLFPGAARARVETVSPVDEDPHRLRLRAEVEAGAVLEVIFPFHYVLMSTAVTPEMTPLRASRRVEQNGDARFLALTFEHRAGQVLLSDRADAEPFASMPIEPETRDLLTALFHARSSPRDGGPGFTLFEDGLYDVRLARQGREELEVPAGRFRASRYAVEARSHEGEPPVGDVVLWLSDDRRRLPLKLRASTVLGELVAELVSWRDPPARD